MARPPYSSSRSARGQGKTRRWRLPRFSLNAVFGQPTRFYRPGDSGLGDSVYRPNAIPTYQALSTRPRLAWRARLRGWLGNLVDWRGTLRAMRAKGLKWWVKWIALVTAATLVLLVLFLAITAPISQSLRPIVEPQITLLASNGEPIARRGAIIEERVQAAELPDHVIAPFLAIEDRRFYEHWGVDPRGLARAVWSNMAGDGGVQGGSTITQQLAKLSYLSPERSLTRKAHELLIAGWLELWLSKDEILSRYLSNAYFGDNLYGLRAASLHYFNRQPERLRPQQAILLAGLVQAPSRYAPTRHPERARNRANTVRAAMVAAGYLTPEQAEALPRAVIDTGYRSDVPVGSYFADWAMAEARALNDDQFSTLEMTTTLDADFQALAERTVARAGLGEAQVALVAMRTNGEVVAMVGGRDYSASPFNRATQAQRQPGSTFKLFVWLAALESGWTADLPVLDAPFEEGSYRPENIDGRYRGEIRLHDAFVKSSNVSSVRIIQEVGDAAVIAQARNLGITADMADGDPSLALGTAEVPLIEMVSAYAGFAANSWPMQPHAFVQDDPSWWDRLWNGRSAYSEETHSQMMAMLRGAVENGTGRAARLTIPTFGKTGTSQDNRDAMFIGFAGDLVVGVWVGNDDNAPLGNVVGGGLPARIWRSFMAGAIDGAAVLPAAQTDSDEDEATDGDPEEGDKDGLNFEGTINGQRIEFDEENGLTISTEVGDQPVDVTIGEDGMRVRPGTKPPD